MRSSRATVLVIMALPTGGWTGKLYLYNGWNSVVDNNGDPSVGVSAAYSSDRPARSCSTPVPSSGPMTQAFVRGRDTQDTVTLGVTAWF